MAEPPRQQRTPVDEMLHRIELDAKRVLELGANAIPELWHLFQTAQDPRIRGRAVYALSLLEDDTSELVLRALQSSKREVRRSIAAAARFLPIEQKERVLFSLLHDSDSLTAHIAANEVPIPSRGLAMPTDATKERSSSAAADTTLCQEGGPEIPATIVTVHTGDRCQFRYFLCKTTARIRIYLTVNGQSGQLLAEAQGEDKVEIVLPLLPVGRHLLHWGFQGASLRWQTRAEFLVNHVCRFRHLKSNEGNDPVNRGFVVIEVLGQPATELASAARA